VTSALRAALCAAPTIIVLAGSAWIAQVADGKPERASASVPDQETVNWPSREDEDRIHRLAIKQEAAADLLNGLLTLEETIARFRDVIDSSPECLNNLRLTVPGDTDEERIVNQIVLFARVHAGTDPHRYAAARARLEQQAKSMTAATGPTH
jgi:hypothetical protein